MLKLNGKRECSGCGACADTCPKDAIRLVADVEGFRYPQVDANKCIHCGKCESVCPMRNNNLRPGKETAGWTPEFFAAQLLDRNELDKVSSGGAFWALAKTVVLGKGVVYGAMLEDLDTIRHVRAATLDEAAGLRRSKYLPSDLSGIYRTVRKDLDQGSRVLFSGTGCQVAGLLSFLGRPRENLVTCEVVCHGIPSPDVWRAWRKEHESAVGKRIVGLIFRDKSAGWKNNQYRIEYEDGSSAVVPSVTHDFHAGYLAGLFSRPSCGRCPFASLPRKADLTLADYWQYHGDLSDERASLGVSLVSVNSHKGATLLGDSKRFLHLEPTSKKKALASCRHLTQSPEESSRRTRFFSDFRKGGYFHALKRNRSVRRSGFPQRIGKWIRRAKTLSSGLFPDGRLREPETISLVEDYCRELGLVPRLPRNIFGAFRLARVSQNASVVISGNPFDLRLARRLGLRTEKPDLIRERASLYFAIKEALVLLSAKGVPVYFFNRVGREKAPEWSYAASAKHRMANGLDFPTMSGAPELYEPDLRELFGDKFSYEYVESMSRIPQVVRTGNEYRHLDCKSDFINVVGGKRITCHQPEKAPRTIHVYGRCGVFGYAVEDADTLPSRIQEELVRAGRSDIRVVNHGLWGADDALIDENFMRDAPGMGPGDIVVFYRKHFDKPLIPKLAEVGLRYFDITHEWHQAPEAKWCFYDRPGHMNRDGYRIAARIIAAHLIETDFQCLSVSGIQPGKLKTPRLTAFLKSRTDETFLRGVRDYVNGILASHPLGTARKCGAIVMNCNPFTKGHRHLIEFASKQVDRLYVFVVEEDKSFFRFEDRFRMVKDGTRDLANVIVVPSGNFIISSLTFPEYFMKDYVKEKNFDASSDVRTFCEHIAPPLGITVRFAGQEPFDPVTERYNQSMRDLLPEYGMAFCEIPRFELDGHKVVSATEVRRLLRENRRNELRTFVPDSTMTLLDAKYTGVAAKE